MGPTRRVRMSLWAARTNLTHPAAPGPRRCLAKRQPIPGGNEQLRRRLPIVKYTANLQLNPLMVVALRVDPAAGKVAPQPPSSRICNMN